MGHTPESQSDNQEEFVRVSRVLRERENTTNDLVKIISSEGFPRGSVGAMLKERADGWVRENQRMEETKQDPTQDQMDCYKRQVEAAGFAEVYSRMVEAVDLEAAAQIPCSYGLEMLIANMAREAISLKQDSNGNWLPSLYEIDHAKIASMIVLIHSYRKNP